MFIIYYSFECFEHDGTFLYVELCFSKFELNLMSLRGSIPVGEGGGRGQICYDPLHQFVPLIV